MSSPIPQGGTNVATTGTVGLVENSVAAIPGGGTLIVTITDHAGGSTVFFSSPPTLPTSLGTSIGLNLAHTAFTINVAGSDALNIEQIGTISSQQILDMTPRSTTL